MTSCPSFRDVQKLGSYGIQQAYSCYVDQTVRVPCLFIQGFPLVVFCRTQASKFSENLGTWVAGPKPLNFRKFRDLGRKTTLLCAH